jgi:hypothetical protein
MNVIEIHIDELIPYDNNPRKNDKAVDYVANSIREFGFKVPIVIDANNTIVCGHTRVKAAKKIGLTKIPCVVADDLTDNQIKAFRLADNKTAELSEWDMDKLELEFGEIDPTEIDLSDFGFFVDDESDEDVLSKYTKNIKIPQYEITKDEPPNLESLVSCEKAIKLLENIDNSNVTEGEKAFLRLAACRHYVFNYRDIAEYYAHATAEMQQLMEDSALVIIDFDDAIANGYIKLRDEIADMFKDDNEE